MTGVCKYCGQIQEVNAATQEEADRIATKNCKCDTAFIEGLFKRAKDNLVFLVGEKCGDFGFQEANGDQKSIIEINLRAVCEQHIDEAKLDLGDSILTIKRRGDRVNVRRTNQRKAEISA